VESTSNRSCKQQQINTSGHPQRSAFCGQPLPAPLERRTGATRCDQRIYRRRSQFRRRTRSSLRVPHTTWLITTANKLLVYLLYVFWPTRLFPYRLDGKRLTQRLHLQRACDSNAIPCDPRATSACIECESQVSRPEVARRSRCSCNRFISHFPFQR